MTNWQGNLVEPAQPPIEPDYPARASNQQITIAEKQHDRRKAEWRTLQDATKQLRKQLLEAVPHLYIASLADDDTEFANVSPLAIMDRLWDKFGDITPELLEANLKKIEEPWNPTEPITQLWNRFKDCKDLAVKGQEPIQDSVIVRHALNILTASGVFEHDVRDWDKKPDADKTLDNLKTHFNAAEKRRLAKQTSGSAGYAGAAIAGQPLKYCHTHGLNATMQEPNAQSHPTFTSQQLQSTTCREVPTGSNGVPEKSRFILLSAPKRTNCAAKS